MPALGLLLLSLLDGWLRGLRGGSVVGVGNLGLVSFKWSDDNKAVVQDLRWWARSSSEMYEALRQGDPFKFTKTTTVEVPLNYVERPDSSSVEL